MLNRLRPYTCPTERSPIHSRWSRRRGCSWLNRQLSLRGFGSSMYVAYAPGPPALDTRHEPDSHRPLPTAARARSPIEADARTQYRLSWPGQARALSAVTAAFSGGEVNSRSSAPRVVRTYTGRCSGVSRLAVPLGANRQLCDFIATDRRYYRTPLSAEQYQA